MFNLVRILFKKTEHSLKIAEQFLILKVLKSLSERGL
jgi:hypothetical protein